MAILMKPTTPHLAFPFRIMQKGYGLAAVENEQDTIEDIEACVELVVRTPRGFRPEAPDFGVTDQTFAMPGVDIDLLEFEVTEAEPRVELASDSYKEEADLLIESVVLRVGGSRVSGDIGV